MTAFFLHSAVWPISLDCRPKPLRKNVTTSDLQPEILRHHTKVVEELNLVSVDVWVADGKPGRGWNGWATAHITLDEAVALPGR